MRDSFSPLLTVYGWRSVLTLLFKNHRKRRKVKRQQELDTARPIVFYCKSGVRSKAALLAVRSFSQEAELYSLEGGIERYMAIYPDENHLVVS